MRKYAYPPGPKSKTPVGDISRLLDAMRDPTGVFLNIANQYGDIAHFKLVYRHAYLLNHHEYIQNVLTNHYENFIKGWAWERGKGILGEGLLTSEGGFHQRQRRLAKPAFHKSRIASYGAVMTELAEKAQGSWREGEALDVSQDMYRLTLAIVAKTLFGAEVESETENISFALGVFRREWWRTLWLVRLPFYNKISKLPFKTFRDFNKARQMLDTTIYRIINERRLSGTDKGDLLSMLLLAQDEGGVMTDLQARDEVMTIFLAGHETTAASLTWAWYLLSQHPEVEERLHREVDAVLGGRLPTFDDLPKLEYTRMVFAETIRLYPPVWMTTRRPIKDIKLGPYVIPYNSIVLICPYVTHRKPEYYPEPLKFDPQRWTPESESKLPKFAYFPFGGGPRHCLGEQFAWMESVLVIATIAQRWKLRLEPGHQVEAEPYVTLRAKYGMRMKPEKRHAAPNSERLGVSR